MKPKPVNQKLDLDDLFRDLIVLKKKRVKEGVSDDIVVEFGSL